MNKYEEKQNRAFNLLISTFAKQMRDEGVPQSEIMSFMNDAILGMVNTIQNDGALRETVHGVITEIIENQDRAEMRRPGIVSEVLDTIEQALCSEVNNIIGHNNISDFTEERLRREYGVEMDSVTKVVFQMFLNNDFKTKS